jgi:hypothetical protein
MTVIITDDKDRNKQKIPYEEYINPWITIQDIRICSIRKVPIPKIVNNIYKPNPKGDTWYCRNCKTRGDKWYLMIHLCKASMKETPKTQLEIQNEEEQIRRRLEGGKWTCPYCKEVTDRFFKKFHYKCLPKEKKRELEREEKPKFEKCLYCDKLVDPYYKNFHFCKGLNRSV